MQCVKEQPTEFNLSFIGTSCGCVMGGCSVDPAGAAGNGHGGSWDPQKNNLPSDAIANECLHLKVDFEKKKHSE